MLNLHWGGCLIRQRPDQRVRRIVSEDSTVWNSALRSKRTDLATPLDGAAGALCLVEAREALAEGVRGRRCGVRPGAGRWQADGGRRWGQLSGNK